MKKKTIKRGKGSEQSTWKVKTITETKERGKKKQKK